MDADSHDPTHRYSMQNVQADGGTVHRPQVHEMQCMVCARAFVPSIGVNEGLDSMTICRECKSLVMDDNDSIFAARNFSRSQRRRGSTHGSSESVESVFSQQFSQLIGMVRQDRDLQLDDDATVSIHQRSSYSSYRSRIVRRPYSEIDNESVDIMDSLFGETDSHISLYGGESDASFDLYGIDRETPSPLGYESRIPANAGIDPMHAGIDQWSSDDPSTYGEWDDRSIRDASIQFMEPNRRAPDITIPDGGVASPRNLWRVRHMDLFTDSDEVDLSPFTGNSGDYLDSRGFEELLEQLVEADNSRIGAPPAAASSLQNLPRLIVSKDHEKNGTLLCAVCKDPLSIDSEVRKLPCSHLYHPSCILPWLRMRNSCPICRYELPTDDLEYEAGKQNTRTEIQHQVAVDESYYGGSSDPGDEANNNEDIDGSGDAAHGSNHGRRWFLIAAAPLAAILGVAIAVFVRNSLAGGRIRIRRNSSDRNLQQSQRSRGAIAGKYTSRSW
ncbi:E3 ubiquitin-protein ligase RING1-like [Platanthera guangdongensis]|uniref:E3 ubiquitin-protein ligase RING1-like n=1 Tax=Platanthera guangdongensis TaxID=2320717 RepID=A0ABR2MEB3_9ASPA